MFILIDSMLKCIISVKYFRSAAYILGAAYLLKLNYLQISKSLMRIIHECGLSTGFEGNSMVRDEHGVPKLMVGQKVMAHDG